jgi:hypothetical protein
VGYFWLARRPQSLRAPNYPMKIVRGDKTAASSQTQYKIVTVAQQACV